MPFELPPLPYPYEALEPHISAKTLQFHHDKHHAKYVELTNKLVADSELANADLETVVKTAWANKNAGLFNNAAQVYNHTFYFNCMKSNGGGKPAENSKIGTLIARDFGSFETFHSQFADACATQFGSGWAWLVLENDKLKIVKTSNAETPLVSEGVVPLLTCDVWEHAYYLDYQNLRPSYVSAFLDNLVNWDFVESNLPN